MLSTTGAATTRDSGTYVHGRDVDGLLRIERCAIGCSWRSAGVRPNAHQTILFLVRVCVLYIYILWDAVSLTGSSGCGLVPQQLSIRSVLYRQFSSCYQEIVSNVTMDSWVTVETIKNATLFTCKLGNQLLAGCLQEILDSQDFVSSLAFGTEFIGSWTIASSHACVRISITHLFWTSFLIQLLVFFSISSKLDTFLSY
jgi:hypothetical protein